MIMVDHLTAGGNGVDGTLTLLGADGKPLLQTLLSARNGTTVKSSELRLGTAGRVGLLSMVNQSETRTVRLDAEQASVFLGDPKKGGFSATSRQIMLAGDDTSEQFYVTARSKDTQMSLGIRERPGRLQVHGTQTSVTGAPVELRGAEGQLHLGRSGTNGAITLFSADAKERVGIDANGSIRAGGNGAVGNVVLSGPSGQPVISMAAGSGTIAAGGGGTGGRLLLSTPDGRKSVQLTVDGSHSFLGIGDNVRPARVSLFGAAGETVRLDGATGDIALLNADCAEQFDLADATAGDAEPGTVLVFTDDGTLTPSEKPYDTRVAGVVSGAGDYRPGLVLDHRDTGRRRAPVALMGKVFCRVDATDDPVAVGDLLTTADTPGHAMRAGDAGRAFGAVLGKAMAPLASGRAMIPILVSLQ
jgi:hypothetical protein